MGLTEIFKISGAIITSIGGASIIIFALSSWLGKIWASRILEKDRLQYASELESIKNQLHIDAQRQQTVFSMYFEAQFRIYNDLWVSLSALQNEVDKLWGCANSRNLKSFVSSLAEAKTKIRNSALLISKNHYQEIMEVIYNLENYQIGKEKLINARRSTENITDSNIQEIIVQNRENKDKIAKFVNHMLEEMRTQISEQKKNS